MNGRLNEIDIFIKVFCKSEEECIKQKKVILDKIKATYNDYLHNFEYIEIIDPITRNKLDISRMKPGGVVRTFTYDAKLGISGILLRVSHYEDNVLLLLYNKYNGYIEIQCESFYIFYRPHKTVNDKLKEIFLKYYNIHNDPPNSE